MTGQRCRNERQKTNGIAAETAAVRALARAAVVGRVDGGESCAGLNVRHGYGGDTWDRA